MLEDWIGVDNARYVFWVALGFLALIATLIVFLLIRRALSGTYVAGGRNRRQRLAVLDATPIDARRRLVLVRRDDVEHLILIGGPTDVVVEPGIRPGVQPRAAAPAPQAVQRPPEPQAAPPPAPRAAPPLAPRFDPVQPPRPAAPPRFEPLPEPRKPVAAEPVKPVEEKKPQGSPFRRVFAAPKPAEPEPAVRKAEPQLPAIAAAPAIATADDIDIDLEEEMNRLLGEMDGPSKG